MVRLDEVKFIVLHRVFEMIKKATYVYCNPTDLLCIVILDASEIMTSKAVVTPIILPIIKIQFSKLL